MRIYPYSVRVDLHRKGLGAGDGSLVGTGGVVLDNARGHRLVRAGVAVGIAPQPQIDEFLGEGFSNTWWPIRLIGDDPLDDRILAIWLNSILGLVGRMGASDETEGPWIAIKKDRLRTLPVLDPRELDGKTRRMFSEAWNEIAYKDLGTLSALREDQMRAEIDFLAGVAFDMDPNHLAVLRDMLDREPRSNPQEEVEETTQLPSLFEAVSMRRPLTN